MKETSDHRILLVGLDGETRERLAPILKRRDLIVDTVERGRDVGHRLRRGPIDLVVSAYPLPDMLLRELIRTIQDDAASGPTPALLVLTIPEMRVEAEVSVSGMPGLVRSRQEPLGLLHNAVAHLLSVEPRIATRADVRMQSKMNNGRVELIARIVNISLSGMLLETDSPLEIDTAASFELEFPGRGGAVRGTAEVVRHTHARRERVHGMAVRFLTFEAGADEALRAQLRLS